jgi:hypothetical protein
MANEGVVAKTCCSLEVLTKLTMYPSLPRQLVPTRKAWRAYPAVIRGRRILTNNAVAFAIISAIPPQEFLAEVYVLESAIEVFPCNRL